MGGGKQQDTAVDDPRDPAQPENDTINGAKLSAIWAAIIAGHSRIASNSLDCIYQKHKIVHRPQDPMLACSALTAQHTSRHHRAGRIILAAIEAGAIGGCIRCADVAGVSRNLPRGSGDAPPHL
jgi:hypothetical protein